jgi:hypothetical protein
MRGCDEGNSVKEDDRKGIQFRTTSKSVVHATQSRE